MTFCHVTPIYENNIDIPLLLKNLISVALYGSASRTPFINYAWFSMDN